MILDEALPHLPRLRRYAHLLTGDGASADDLLQDTLERAAAKWALWQPERGHGTRAEALRAWLLTLMHRLFLNQLRDLRQHLYEEYQDEASPAPDPQAQLHLRLDLERALAALPAISREVLLLVCVEELSYEAAAEVLDLPVGTVMSRLSRARERLRALMQGEAGVAAGARLRVVK
ncbi:RNA polymerase sigma factor [Paucibacter sp. APW11]|uniref:RNA polymerase sigma factor n=1 Tax=Roseateles aquae TaxID=3077235 RepID=A0ABU3PCJ5_9BURK|nr:RNA polymerase sigma factor [Paucibacter sp. APW11]MDT9000284.1 RNA polymerase sigma factor [Paucibacter sp. APW11]